MALKLSIGKCTLSGYYRESNEDSIDVKLFPQLDVWIVADGMGGPVAGEAASKCAVEVIPHELQQKLTEPTDAVSTCAIIRRAIVLASDEIIKMGVQDRELKHAGSTVVVAVWRQDRSVFIAGVGDSRAYLIRDRKIEQLTTDHSLAKGRGGRVLWKYLGTRQVGEGPDVKSIPVLAGDRFLLCTDGLSSAVADDRILSFVLSQLDVQTCADGLGQLALDSGSKDNVSCVVIEVNEGR
jgi:serine/threonine protein phosphatase PrpC